MCPPHAQSGKVKNLLSPKIFRQINSLVKTLLSRNFCQKWVRLNPQQCAAHNEEIMEFYCHHFFVKIPWNQRFAKELYSKLIWRKNLHGRGFLVFPHWAAMTPQAFGFFSLQNNVISRKWWLKCPVRSSPLNLVVTSASNLMYNFFFLLSPNFSK